MIGERPISLAAPRAAIPRATARQAPAKTPASEEVEPALVIAALGPGVVSDRTAAAVATIAPAAAAETALGIDRHRGAEVPEALLPSAAAVE